MKFVGQTKSLIRTLNIPHKTEITYTISFACIQQSILRVLFGGSYLYEFTQNHKIASSTPAINISRHIVTENKRQNWYLSWANTRIVAMIAGAELSASQQTQKRTSAKTSPKCNWPSTSCPSTVNAGCPAQH